MSARTRGMTYGGSREETDGRGYALIVRPMFQEDHLYLLIQSPPCGHMYSGCFGWFERRAGALGILGPGWLHVWMPLNM